MNAHDLDLYLIGAIGVCGFGVLLNLVLVKKRGRSAVIMASAFALLGGTLQLYRIGASQVLISAGVLAVFALLVIDMGMRAKRQGSRR